MTTTMDLGAGLRELSRSFDSAAERARKDVAVLIARFREKWGRDFALYLEAYGIEDFTADLVSVHLNRSFLSYGFHEDDLVVYVGQCLAAGLPLGTLPFPEATFTSSSLDDFFETDEFFHN